FALSTLPKLLILDKVHSLQYEVAHRLWKTFETHAEDELWKMPSMRPCRSPTRIVYARRFFLANFLAHFRQELVKQFNTTNLELSVGILDVKEIVMQFKEDKKMPCHLQQGNTPMLTPKFQAFKRMPT